jgi:hypothetical protein
MIGVVLIFGVPLIVAATLLSPPGLDYLLAGLVRYTAVMLLLLPFVGWPLLLAEGISPSGGGS